MKIKLYYPNPVQEQEGIIGKSLRNAAGTIAQAGSNLASLATIPESLYKHAEGVRNKAVEHALQPGNEKYLYGSNAQDTRKGLDEYKKSVYQPKAAQVIEKGSKAIKSLFSDKYLEPHTENEETFQDYASMIPLHLLSGGTVAKIPSLLTRTAAGRGVGKGVESLGGGTAGKIAAEIGVPALLEGINLSNISKKFTPYKKEIYNELPKIAGNAKINADSLLHSLEEAGSRAEGRIGHSLIYKNLNHIKNNIKDGHIDLKDLQPLKSKLNTLVYKDKRDVLKPVLSQVNSLISQHPEYSRALKDADKLHSLFNNIDKTNSFVKELTKLKGYKTKYGLFGKALSLLTNIPGKEETKLLYNLGNRFPKETAQYALGAFEAATKQQAPQFIKYAADLQKLIDKVEKEEPQGKVRLYYPN